ncbi:MAG: DUF2975 domain-containing protein [Methanomassiliicoccaceae archaeon]|nr:DUF2975 domain-containing protein [Methanomassiliicoccaceae archaeon]
MSDTLNKLNRLSGYAEVLSKIIMVVLVIVIVGACIVLALTYADLSAIEGILEEWEVMPADNEIRAVALNAIAMCAIGLVIMYYVHRLFTNIHKSNALFTDANVEDLRTIAILLLIAAVVLTAVVSLTTFYLLDTTDIVVGFNPLMMLMTALIIYMVSLIFRYGTELQRQSDETL